jgi:hypothetical protein
VSTRSKENTVADDKGDGIDVLRDKAKRTDTAENENVKLRKELAFAKAGLDVENEDVAWFMDAYDGELDTEAITDRAKRFALIDEPEPEPEIDDTDLTTPGEGQAVIGTTEIARDVGGDEGEYVDVLAKGLEVAQKAIDDDGENVKDALGIAIAHTTKSVNEGNRQAVLDVNGRRRAEV